MEIQELLTVKELLNLAKTSRVIEIPNEIYDFFDMNFIFEKWNWQNKNLFWQFFRNFYSCSINYQDSIIYLANLANKEKLIESASWIIRILQDEQARPRNQEIAFELAYCIPNFWQISYDEGITFSESSKRLALLYLTCIEIDFPVNCGDSVNKKEMMIRLYSYLEHCQWREIQTNYYQINSIYNNIHWPSHCSYLFMVEHQISEIITLINNEIKVWRLLYWLAHLPEKYKQPVVLKTDNELAKFLLLLDLEYLIRNGLKQEQLQLSEIWDNSPTEWFQIFNKYPVRYPWLQLGLGKFLTSATNEQIQLYIDSIDLSTAPEVIQDCLKYFLEHSSQENIHYFCKLAYKKWETWGFGDSYSIQQSCLDIVIVKYFQEFVTDKERKEFIDNEINQILSFNKIWFTSIVELNEFIYFHLSRMQPACMALNQDDSLSIDELNTKLCYPNFFQEDSRWKNWVDCSFLHV